MTRGEDLGQQITLARAKQNYNSTRNKRFVLRTGRTVRCFVRENKF